jgi:hypothetical protein
MLPQPLIEAYWDRVCRVLQEDYHLERSQSENVVSQYRAEVEPRMAEMTYHQDVEEVAQTIYSGRETLLREKADLYSGQ